MNVSDIVGSRPSRKQKGDHKGEERSQQGSAAEAQDDGNGEGGLHALGAGGLGGQAILATAGDGAPGVYAGQAKAGAGVAQGGKGLALQGVTTVQTHVTVGEGQGVGLTNLLGPVVDGGIEAGGKVIVVTLAEGEEGIVEIVAEKEESFGKIGLLLLRFEG